MGLRRVLLGKLYRKRKKFGENRMFVEGVGAVSDSAHEQFWVIHVTPTSWMIGAHEFCSYGWAAIYLGVCVCLGVGVWVCMCVWVKV